MKYKSLIVILLNVVFIAVSLGVIILTFNDLPLQVPLFYSLPWGDGQLASKQFLFILPLFSVIILIFNFFFLKIFRITQNEEDERLFNFIKDMLVFVSFVCGLINLITIIKIVRLFV